MNKAIFTLLVVVMVGVGYVAYIHSTRIEQENVVEDSQTQRISISMICNDTSYFIAEFPSSTSLEVIVDGVLTRTLPQVEGYGYRFEDAEYAYVFAGEGVTVTNKSTNTVTLCAQPFDPNLAPFNFGDAAEGGGDAVDIVKIVAESLVDRWQSADEPTLVREFMQSTFVDYREGSEIQHGTWRVYTQDSEEAPVALGEEQLVHLAITMSKNNESNTEYFVVKRITPEVLELINESTKEVSTYNRL